MKFVFFSILFVNAGVSNAIDILKGKNELLVYWNSNNLNPKFNAPRNGFFDMAGINAGINFSRSVIQGKLGSLSLFSGINYRAYHIDFKPDLQYYPNLPDEINVSRRMAGLNLGFSFENNILSYKNLKLSLGGGVFVTQMLIAPQKTVSFFYDIPNNANKNYVIFNFNRNTMTYPYPFFRFKINHRIKNENWVYGVKFNVSNDFTTKTNINYRAVFDYVNNQEEAHYKFEDVRNQWEIFIGFSF